MPIIIDREAVNKSYIYNILYMVGLQIDDDDDDDGCGGGGCNYYHYYILNFF